MSMNASMQVEFANLFFGVYPPHFCIMFRASITKESSVKTFENHLFCKFVSYILREVIFIPMLVIIVGSFSLLFHHKQGGNVTSTQAGTGSESRSNEGYFGTG